MEIDHIFQDFVLRTNIIYAISEDFAILAMVEQGLGVSILSEMVVQGSGRQVAAIPLERPQFREIGLAVRRGESLSPLTRRFREFVFEWLETSYPVSDV